MVGPPRGLEELPRPVALGGIRRVFRNALRFRAPRPEGVPRPNAPGDGPSAQDRHSSPYRRAARPHLDGPADFLIANRSQFLSESYLLEGWLRAANVAHAALRRKDPGHGSSLQGHDAGLLPHLRQ